MKGSEPNQRAFISHSSPDDRYVQEFVQLVESLGYEDTFNDSHSIEPDAYFWEEIEKGIRSRDAFVVILSHASVQSDWVDREVEFARAEGKRVIPVRIDDCELPESFNGRDVIELRQGQGERFKLAPSRLLRHAPKRLFGREEWLDELDEIWESRPSVNVYSLIAWGGAGKTALAVHWINQRLAKRGWPGVGRYFDWSFYSQGASEQSQASADFFIAAALGFFGDPDPQMGSPWERGQRLAGLVQQHRTLLVLDGVEPLQYPPNSPQAGEFKDQALEALLNGLAARNPGLCLVSSREPLKNLETFHGGAGAEEKELNQLTKEAAIALLRHLSINGTEAEMEAAWEDAGGHALTLQLLGRFIVDAHGGDIRKRAEVRFEVADRETPGRTAMKVMRAYEKWLESAGSDRQRDLAVLRLMGLFDRPAGGDCLAALRAEPAIPGLTDDIIDLEDWEWTKAVKDLESLDLISVSGDSAIENPQSAFQLGAHPLVREYFASQLQQTAPEAFHAAHSRLFDHLCETTPHRPDGIEGLQPLYQAVSHGCLAGRQQEACDKVYRDRILRGTGYDGFYSTKKLGAIGADLGAVAAFFEKPWQRLSPNLSEAYQAWLLNAAAFRLRALGRLTEALDPMRVSGEMDVAVEKWEGAAISYSNLSELEVTLGRLGEAVADGRRAIDFADRSGDANWPYLARITAADALHQRGEPKTEVEDGRGDRDEARALFEEAERIQAENQPEFPLLYSLQGFRYGDLIMAPAEREVWRVLLIGGRCAVGAQALSKDGDAETKDASLPADVADNHARDGALTAQRPPSFQEALAACTEAKRRGEKLFEWRLPSDSLLAIALDHLTLARAGLYEAILSGSAFDSGLKTENWKRETSQALNGLREASDVEFVAKALLTAALCEAVTGDADQAEAHLREAQQIADRGPMPLYLADVHLHRARLFRDRAELARARELIDQHEYGRRREELEDAEKAAEDW